MVPPSGSGGLEKRKAACELAPWKRETSHSFKAVDRRATQDFESEEKLKCLSIQINVLCTPMSGVKTRMGFTSNHIGAANDCSQSSGSTGPSKIRHLL